MSRFTRHFTKLFALLACLVLLLSAVGCGSVVAPDPDSSDISAPDVGPNDSNYGDVNGSNYGDVDG